MLRLVDTPSPLARSGREGTGGRRRQRSVCITPPRAPWLMTENHIQNPIQGKRERERERERALSVSRERERGREGGREGAVGMYRDGPFGS